MAVLQFKVEEGLQAVVSAHGLEPETDVVVLWRQVCSEGCATSNLWIEFRPNGCLQTMDFEHNPMHIDVPGTYQLRFEGTPNDDVVFCVEQYKCHKN